MTEIHIPYLPSAKFFKVLCRLGVHEQDISSDTDSNPQIRTIGGTVTISASIGRFRYTEADGRSRVVYNKTETYNIQTSTGELFDVDGNLGVNLLDTTSPGIDPQGWTYKATVRPTGGEPFDVNIPASLEPAGTLDLGDGLVFTPSTGITDLETRVKALEDAGPSSGGSGPVSWDDITNKPSEFAPSMHDHTVDDISDSTATGRSLVTAANAAAARTAIGVGTATATTAGIVELATTAEATAGTDTQRAVTPAGLKAAVDAKSTSNTKTVNTITAAASVTVSTAYAVNKLTMTQNTTITPDLSAGSDPITALHLSGAFTPTFAASIEWSDGTAPTYTGPAVYVFLTVDGGTSWLGVQSGKAFA